jgi:ATP-binding cassette, subfamily B, bacterial
MQNQNDQLLAAIQEGVSKGVPMDFIGYSLKRAGWPKDMVDAATNDWLLKNGRAQKSTAFGDWLKRYYRQAKSAIILIVVLNTIASAIALLKPWPVKLLADSVFGPIPAPGPLAQYTGTPTLILVVSLLTLMIFVVGAAFGVFKDFALLRIGFWLNKSIKEESFRHILHLPMYHEGRLPKGDYIYRQNDVTNSLSDLVLTSTSEILESIILVVGVLIIMFSINAKLTLISVIVIPFLVLSIRMFGPVMAGIGKLQVKLSSKIATLITESIDNTEVVQAFTLQERQVQKLNKLWQDNFEISKKGLLWGKGFDFTNGLIVILGTSAVIYLGGTEALNHKFTLGNLLIFMTYLGYLIGPIQDITTQITVRRQKLVSVHRVYEVLNDHEGVETLRADQPLGRVQGQIDFQNVSFNYKDTMVLNHVNLSVKPGEKVGIIGPSGSGKSTLLRLLALYDEPTAGRVLLDGHDVQTVSLGDVRRNIAWVSQSPQLFAASIIDNIVDGDIYRQITPQEIAWASQAANIDEFVKKLPMGMESVAGEGGTALSGGQRQRIAIARALIKNAPIICLDEPTSALDDRSEHMIQESLGALIHDKTVLLVTHRLPLLSLMDTVYVLDQGNLIDVARFGGVEKYVYQMQVAGRL